jgi:hypothetical protein
VPQGFFHFKVRKSRGCVMRERLQQPQVIAPEAAGSFIVIHAYDAQYFAFPQAN